MSIDRLTFCPSACRVTVQCLAAGVVALFLPLAAARATPSTSVSVSGQVGSPTSFSLPALQALPQSTQTDMYTAAGTQTTDTFSGPTLLSLLNAAGGIVTNPAVKNDVLRQYILATGTDGYTVAVSAGEIEPSFGNKQFLTAISDTGGTLPGSASVARLTAPGDVAGGRYVSNLQSIVVGTAPAVGATGGGITSSIAVQGGVLLALNLSAASLAALPQHTEMVTYQAGTTSVTDTYTGPLLWDALSAAGIVTDPTIKNDILRKLVSVTGSDGYQVDLSLGEIDPAFGDEDVLLATSDTDGQFPADGLARLVVPGDTAGGRYVSNIASLTVFDPTVAVPEPTSLALLGTGLAGLGFIRRRNRKV